MIYVLLVLSIILNIVSYVVIKKQDKIIKKVGKINDR